MATTIRDLLVRLGVDSDDAEKGIAELDASLSDLKDVMLGAVAVAGALTAALGALVVSAAGAGDAIDKGATAAAITTDAYQELDFVASQMGTTIGVLTKALGKQTTALRQLEDGAGIGGEGLKKLGFAYADLQALSPDEQFIATADALSKLTNEQERAQLATLIYGEDMGQVLLPILGAGAQTIEELSAKAHDLGIVLSEEGVANAVLFTDTLDELWRVIGGIKNAIGLALMPAVTDLLVRLRDWWLANSRIINQRMERWLDAMLLGMKAMVRAAETLDEVVVRTFGSWDPILEGVAVSLGLVAAAMTGLAALKAWAAIQAVMTAVAGVGAVAFAEIIVVVLGVAAALAAVVLVVDDLIVFFRGGESALGDFLETNRDAEGVLGSVVDVIDSMVVLVQKLAPVLARLGDVAKRVFDRTLLPGLKLVGAALKNFVALEAQRMATLLDEVVVPAVDGLSTALELILSLLDSIGPAMDGAFGLVDEGLAKLSQLWGVDLTVGGTADLTGPTLAQSIVGSELFAPTPLETISNAAGAFGSAITNRNTDLQVAGNNITINGAGLTLEQVQQVIDQTEAARARMTSAALEGAEV